MEGATSQNRTTQQKINYLRKKKGIRKYYASCEIRIQEQKARESKAQRQSGLETSRNPDPPDTKLENTRNKDKTAKYQNWKRVMCIQHIRNRIQAQDTSEIHRILTKRGGHKTGQYTTRPTNGTWENRPKSKTKNTSKTKNNHTTNQGPREKKIQPPPKGSVRQKEKYSKTKCNSKVEYHSQPENEAARNFEFNVVAETNTK